jgi:D-arabinose 1-dehydrogenase-like Zn-dependent alcohol dehydrogenase
VAILGIGGLGHLAIQFARHFGYRTVALTGTAGKADLARQLGAHDVIHLGSTDPVEALLALGGARVILATAPNSGLISQLVRALGHDGQLITVVGGGEPIRIDPGAILGRRLAIRGWRVDDPQELPRTLAFSQLAGIRARVEVYPLDDVNRAVQRMLDGAVNFRAVLVPHSGGA